MRECPQVWTGCGLCAVGDQVVGVMQCWLWIVGDSWGKKRAYPEVEAGAVPQVWLWCPGEDPLHLCVSLEGTGGGPPAVVHL